MNLGQCKLLCADKAKKQLIIGITALKNVTNSEIYILLVVCPVRNDEINIKNGNTP